MIGEAFPQVLAAAQVGSDWAWERLFASVAACIRGYVTAQGASDPDDLTGEVLLQLVRGLPRFAGDEGAFRSWVFVIAHHRVIDERRRRRRDTGLAAHHSPVHGSVPADPEVLDRLGESEWAERLAQLTEDQRTVLLLRVVAGLSSHDVARIVGKEPGAVRVLQHRALARLRDILSTGVTR